MISRFAQLALAGAAALSCLDFVGAQTFTSCNPLTNTCPADPALGRSATVDFTKGASDLFTSVSTVTYASDGAHFTVGKTGDSPQIDSKFYIMFGKMSVTMKAAPGKGIVSSAVLISDDLDEIDFEWLGADDAQVQSNYFGKGQTITYDRGAFHANPGNQEGFHTYTVDWTANQIAWEIDGKVVRTLAPAQSNNQYPQTPMQVKIGAWSGGDPGNAPGTIQWAQGPTNYANGPYTMVVSSVAVTDYSTGTQYKYNGNSGSWSSIVAVGGTVNPNGPGSGSSSDSSSNNQAAQPAPSSTKPAPAPTTSSISPSVPPAFGGAKLSTSTYAAPSIYPWVPSVAQTTLATKTTTYAYPGLPSGWTVTSNGKVVPPSSGVTPTSTPTCFSSPQELQSSGGSSQGDGSSSSVTTYFDDRGFACRATVAAAGDAPATTAAPDGSTSTVPTKGGVGNKAAASASSSSSSALAAGNAASRRRGGSGFGVVAGVLLSLLGASSSLL